MLRQRLVEFGHDPRSVLAFGYFFPSSKVHGKRMQWTAEDLEAGHTILRHLSDSIAQGLFPATTSIEDCKYCAYNSICGDLSTLVNLSTLKTSDPANASVLAHGGDCEERNKWRRRNQRLNPRTRTWNPVGVFANPWMKNLLVEAAAGTGKTTCIVERMVNLIASGQCCVENMVAVTFTRKAASELRERFQIRVQQRASEAIDSDTCTPDERSRLLVASQRCGNLFIGTIHSFCSHLLRQRPIEFNIDANFRELTAEEDSSLREQAWIENIQDLIASNDPLIQKLNELDIDRSGLKRCFHQFIEFRDITKWGIENPSAVHIDAVRRQTRAFIDEMKALLPLFPIERGTDLRMDRYEQIVLASDRAFQSDARLFRLLERFNSQPKLTLSCCWHDKSVAKSQSQRWDQFRQDVAGPALRWWYEVRYEFVCPVCSTGSAVFERLKKAASAWILLICFWQWQRALRANPICELTSKVVIHIFW